MVASSPYIRYRLSELDEPPTLPVEELPVELIPLEEWETFWRQIADLSRQRAWIDRYVDSYVKVRDVVYAIAAFFLICTWSSLTKRVTGDTVFCVVGALGLWRTCESRVRWYKFRTIETVCQRYHDRWIDRFGVRLECYYEPPHQPLDQNIYLTVNILILIGLSPLGWYGHPWVASGIYLYLYPTPQQYGRVIRWPIEFQRKLKVDASTKAALLSLDESGRAWENWLAMTDKLQQSVNDTYRYSDRAFLAIVFGCACVFYSTTASAAAASILAKILPVAAFCSLVGAMMSGARYWGHSMFWTDTVVSVVHSTDILSLIDGDVHRVWSRMEYQQVFRFHWLAGLYTSHVVVLVVAPSHSLY